MALLPPGLRGFLDDPAADDPEELLERCERFAGSVAREQQDLVARLAKATERQRDEVTKAHRQALEADEMVHALCAECDSTAEELDELEAKVAGWRAPLAKTMADLEDTQAAHAYVQTLHRVGELTREYDALPPAPSAETAAKVAVIEQLAALASTAGSVRGGSAAVGSVLDALDARGSRLRGSLEAALVSSLSEGGWPKEPLQPPSESPWFQTFTDLTKLQVAAWGHGRQVASQRTQQPSSSSSAFVDGSRSALWGMAVLCQPLLRRFRYHFCGSRDTNRLDKPEWMFAFIEKLLVDTKPSLAHLQAALDAGGVGYGVCEAGSELLRPVLQALRGQLRSHVSTLEDELSGAAGRLRLQRQLGSSVAAGSLGMASLAGAALAGLSQVRSEVRAGHGKDLLASSLSTISKVARPMASHNNHDQGAGESGEAEGSDATPAAVQEKNEDTSDGGVPSGDEVDSATVSPANAFGAAEKDAAETDTQADEAEEPTDYLVIFAHYINETLIFERSLAYALGLNIALEEDDIAAAQSGRDSDDDDDQDADSDSVQEPEGKETHVGRPVVGLCLSCVLASGAPVAGPGRRWLELEASQAEEKLLDLISDTQDPSDPSGTTAELEAKVNKQRGIERLSDLGDGSGKPCLAVASGLLEVLDQVAERLRLLPSTRLRKAFVEHVHVPLLADYSGRIDDVGRQWRRGRRDCSSAARVDHYTLGCAIHNSASYVASSLRSWGDELFFLALQETGNRQPERDRRGPTATASPASVRGSGTDAAGVTFFEVDRPGSVEEWRSCAKGMVAALADSIMDEVSEPLRLYVDATAAQGIFWLAPPSGVDNENRATHYEVAAVSEELLPVLADLGTLLQQCEDQLADRAWSALRRNVARQLDGYLFERMLCEMHCTRTGFAQLEQDIEAVFGLFDGPERTGNFSGSPERQGRQRRGSGAVLFRRTGDALKLLRLPATRLEELQAALWPTDDAHGALIPN